MVGKRCLSFLFDEPFHSLKRWLVLPFMVGGIWLVLTLLSIYHPPCFMQAIKSTQSQYLVACSATYSGQAKWLRLAESLLHSLIDNLADKANTLHI